MSDELTAAVVSALISLAVALITYVSVVTKIQAETRTLERQLQRQLTDRLYDLRLKHYPQAFVITERLGKQGADPEKLPALYQQLGRELRDWKSGEPSFLMSEESLQRYYAILEALRANLALGSRYNEQQLERIWQTRTAFRDQLRRDVGLLFDEEKKMA